MKLFYNEKNYVKKRSIKKVSFIVGENNGRYNEDKVRIGYEKITCNGKEGKQEYEANVAIKLIKKLKKYMVME